MANKKVLLIDCEDSFVHTLAGYFRMEGAHVDTRRVGFTEAEFVADLEVIQPTLVCLSPGPGSPEDFGLKKVITATLDAGLPIFGVCLGLQALVEYYGGTLGQLEIPMHGKVSRVDLIDGGGKLFTGVAENFDAGRYHSLYAQRDTLPSELKVTAQTHDDQVIMAIEHESLPIAAVQFHPESIMTMDDNVGQTIVHNALSSLTL